MLHVVIDCSAGGFRVRDEGFTHGEVLRYPAIVFTPDDKIYLQQ